VAEAQAFAFTGTLSPELARICDSMDWNCLYAAESPTKLA
jgi:hypothetical protein